MRILQITKKFPWPLKDGEVLAIFNLTRGLTMLGNEVVVLSLNTNKHFFEVEKLPKEIKSMARFEAVGINTSVDMLSAFFNLFSNASYNIERFYSQEFEDKIAETLAAEKFDMVLMEGIYPMRYIDIVRESTNAKVVLRPHNVEYVIWERLRDAEKNIAKKMYLGLLARRMKRFEAEHINKADVVIPLTETDEKVFEELGCNKPHACFPIGYDTEGLPGISEKEEIAAAFIGGMDWMPNREGVDWFLTQVWPKVLTQIPSAKFYLAGRNFPPELKQLKAKGVTVLGEISDAKHFLFHKSVLIVPLFAGSGIRVKIIEAMALGRAVVSTTIGAEGIDYTAGENIIIADDASAFAAAVIMLLNNRQARLIYGDKAQKLIIEKYDNSKVCSAILDFCKPYLS